MGNKKIKKKINLNSFYFLVIMVQIIITTTESNFVYFPLKSKDDTYLKSLKNITEIMKYIYLEPLISEIIIGDPEQRVNFRFRADCDYIYLTTKKHKVSKPDLTSEYIQKKFGDFSFYNPERSNSINNFDQIKNYSYAYDNQYTSKFISEKIKLNNNIYYMNLTVAEYIEKEEPGAFCLQVSDNDDKSLRFTPSFPNILKKEFNIINNYLWFIYYSQDNKDNYLVIGTSPDEFKNPKTGKLIYPQFDKQNNYFAVPDELNIRRPGKKFKFDDIYILDNDKTTKIEFESYENFMGKLMPNIGFIVGTTNYSNYVEKNIFKKYLENKKCSKGIFNERPELVGEEYTYYYCEESLYDTMKFLYKQIKFKQTSLSEIFELNFDDVFIKQNGYLIFLIIFSTHEHKQWDLGKPFMKKYQFDFDFPNKKIGYYKISQRFKQTNDNDNNINDNNKGKKNVVYATILLGLFFLAVILILFGVIIGKNFFKLRKKRANELDDEFDYNQKKEEFGPIINDNE